MRAWRYVFCTYVDSASCQRIAFNQGDTLLSDGRANGMRIFRIPKSQIVAVSNSRAQKEFIEERSKARNIGNIEIRTSDMNDFSTHEKFDRIISIEMFEHMRNYAKLFELIHGWLEDQGHLFFHVFCHKDTPYFFQEDSREDWMAKNFFSGGVMPAFNLEKIRTQGPGSASPFS